MTRRAVIALGIVQCVNWGVLYYAFAVLVLPLERELAAPAWIVTGAFSLALLVSAAAAPAIGRLGDAGHGVLMMQVGGAAAAALLTAWTISPTVLMFYLVWAGLGLCMGTSLYEPAFVIIGRAYDDPAKRLRALAAVTLFGGLASTVFLPATAWLVHAFGWRGAVLVLAVLLLGSAALVRVCVWPHRPSGTAARYVPPFAHPTERRGRSTHLSYVSAMFGLASFASAAFIVNLFPSFQERGVSMSTAAAVGGLMGVMQLPGRALLMNGSFAGSPSILVAVCLGLHGIGLGAVALAPSTALVVAGTMVFACGAGLMTLVRPHFVQSAFGGSDSGYLNGRIARQQQLARAIGPLAVAWAASGVGYTVSFVVLAFAFIFLAGAWVVVSRRTSATEQRTEAA